MSLPFSSYYLQNYSPECVVSELAKREQMHHYMCRGKGMKRAPKNELYYPGNEHKTYKWGRRGVHW
jgi:hypothetical protein